MTIILKGRNFSSNRVETGYSNRKRNSHGDSGPLPLKMGTEKCESAIILEQPLKRTIEDNLFLLFFLSGWTKNKWIRTFQWQKATV